MESADVNRRVFSDPSGRRWRLIRIVFAAFLVISVGVLGWFLPTVYTSPQNTGQDLGPKLTGAGLDLEIPIIGSGPLERMVKVDAANGLALDPFTGTELDRLDNGALSQVGSADHAVQRYGYSEGLTRSIALTFDDGPDEQVTPRLLDMLSREGVPATFFVLGRSVSHHPELIDRMVREGHAVGTHTLTHPQLSQEPSWRGQAEIVGGERQIRAITGRQVDLWRMPYTAADAALGGDNLKGLLQAQRLGYVHTTYDFDSRDWRYDRSEHGSAFDMPLPDMNGTRNYTILIHDGGGPNRERSVQYAERLIREAKARGYTFHTVPQMAPSVALANAPIAVTAQDHVANWLIKVMFDWPRWLMFALFLIAVAMILGTGLIYFLLAWRRRRRPKREWGPVSEHDFTVSVVLAAYNEEAVISRTLRTILASDYPIAEVVVVDDGSVDSTSQRVRDIALIDDRVKLVRKANRGKAAALNTALDSTDSEIVVTLDADTIMTPHTVGSLVRHFAEDEDSRLGAVAGVVRVGNRTKNLQTRWQALEYVTQIGLERCAQDELGAISIIPGACAAWRKDAVTNLGGFSSTTLAEDCDLALSMHSKGWRVTQDDDALAYTEAPETLDDLLKQRERWTFGTLQSVWKHRKLMFNPKHGYLGFFVLPTYLLAVLLPLVFLPFVGVVTVLLVVSDGLARPLLFYAGFMMIQMLVSAAAVWLMRESPRHLLNVPVYRLVNDPLRAYLLYASLYQALRGGRVSWNKLTRTGSMDSTNITSGPSRTSTNPETTAQVIPISVAAESPRKREASQ